jgi:hypothetical protein
MKSIKRITLLIVAIVSVSITSCNLDVNVDPNSPGTVPNSQLLSSAQVAIFTSFGPNGSGLGQNASIWVHQTMIRSSADNYNPTGTDANVNNPWINLYSGALTDLETIIKQGTNAAVPEWQYVGIAKLLKAYSYATMVDVWGDIPYSEANGGATSPFPKFDKGADIYASLFTLIDEAYADMAKALPSTNIVPAADDLVYGGNITNWKRFAKVLKLKMYNQIRKFKDVSADAKLLVADPEVLAYANDFELKYVNVAAPENRNPSYVSVSGAGTYFSRYFWEILVNKSTLNPILSGIVDPRINYYLYNSLGSSNPTPQNPFEYKDGNFLAINFASQGPNQGFDQSKGLSSPGVYYCGGRYDAAGVGGSILIATWGTGAVPMRLYPKYQLTYIRAELAQQGVTTEDARALLSTAIDESFAKVNSVTALGAPTAPAISNAARDAYRDAVLLKYDAASANGKLEMILTQKWIANFGNPLESYNDYRKTGYPVMFDPNSDEFSFTNVSRGYPVSFPYRQLDLSLNPNAPAQKLVGDASAKVFWDVD